MSEQNVAVVRGMWDAFLRGDLEQARNAYDPDVEWDGTNLPDGEVARGIGAVLRHVAKWAEQWKDWRVEIEEILDAGGDRVVVIMRETGRSDRGLVMDELHGELYTVRDGRIASRKGFSDPHEALEAAGLRE